MLPSLLIRPQSILLIDWYARTGEEQVGRVVTTTLEKMARGGVYDQLAGGFHRYSVDERWCVPHFEKMAYDNSELLKNYVHAWQATANPLFADVARDILRWLREWLSDRERGGYYGSQDADIDLDDDGDYFTWTLEEARAVLNRDELAVAAAHYDIGERGEMHHNPAKNVLWVSQPVEQIAASQNRTLPATSELLASAKKKLYAARLQRPMPYHRPHALHQLECALHLRRVASGTRAGRQAKSWSLRCAPWTVCSPKRISLRRDCSMSLPTRKIRRPSGQPVCSTTMPSLCLPAWTPMRPPAIYATSQVLKRLPRV